MGNQNDQGSGTSNPRLPRMTERHRDDIAQRVADRLLANKRFQRRVIKWLIIVGIFSAGLYAGISFMILRTTIARSNTYLTNSLAEYVRTNDVEVRARLAVYVRTNDFEISNRLFVARQEVTNQITKEFETERIRAIVSNVASNRADALLASQIMPEIFRFREIVSNQLSDVSGSIAKLTNATTFVMAFLSAQGGSRKEYEKLRTWAESRESPFQAQAFQAVVTIMDLHNNAANALGVGYMPPWGTDPDPKHPIEKLRSLYWELNIGERKCGLIQAIWGRSDLSNFEKMNLLAEIIEKEEDLKALGWAGKYFRMGANFNMKTIAADQFLDWWRNHSNTVSTAKPVTK